MDRETLEEPDGFGVFDVATVDEVVDLARLQESERGFHGLITAVRVAEDSDAHDTPHFIFTAAGTRAAVLAGAPTLPETVCPSGPSGLWLGVNPWAAMASYGAPLGPT